MKKISIILALIALTLNVSAQSTTAPYGSRTSGGNDASFLNFATIILSDTAGATIDTVQIRPFHRRIDMQLTVKDSCILYLKSIKGCYYTDLLDLDIICPAQTGIIKFAGKWVFTSGTTSYSLTANKRYLFRFRFDGVDWVQYAVQANYTP